MLLESSWGTLGGLLDPPGRLLGVSWAALAASWAPGGFLERPWRRLGALLESSWSFLEVSWKLLEGSWRRLKVFWQPFGGVLEAFEGFLDAPESILEASGGCLFNYVKSMFGFICFHLIFQVRAPAGPYFGG